MRSGSRILLEMVVFGVQAALNSSLVAASLVLLVGFGHPVRDKFRHMFCTYHPGLFKMIFNLFLGPPPPGGPGAGSGLSVS